MMTEEDKKEVHDCFSRWLSTDVFTESVQRIIKRRDTEKYIERSEQWMQRLPFFLAGLVAGALFCMLATHH